MTRTATGRLLIRLRRSLLLTTIALIVTSFAVWRGVANTAETVHDRTAPAILAVSSAKTALIKADKAAVSSFRRGEVVLAGPGDDYQSQTALASQNLARAAELNQGGEVASRHLQVVEALLSEYLGAVEQADAHYRQPGGTVVGVADLWNASRLLHSGLDGVLVRLDDLILAQQGALDEQLSSGWTGPLVPALWMAPATLLLGPLVWTQWTLAKRFRRRLNPQLIAATVLLAGVVTGLAWTFPVQHDLSVARAALNQVVNGRDSRAQYENMLSQQEIQAMLNASCGQSGGCGPTAASLETSRPPASVAGDAEIDAGIGQTDESTVAATAVWWLQIVIPLAGVAIGALVLWGLQARIDEYRYRA